MTIEEFLNSDVETPVAGSGAVFGLNMDGSVDQTDVGRMSEFNAHHGAYQGVDLRDPNLRGMAIGDTQAKTLGFKNRDEALGQVVKVVNYSTGLISPVQIVDKAPRSQQHVEMTPAAHAEVGSTGKDLLGIARFQSVEDFLGIPKDVKGVTPPETANLPPEDATLQAVLQKNLKAGAAEGVYPKAELATEADRIAQAQTEQPAAPAQTFQDLLKTPSPEILQPIEQGIVDVAKGIPGMITQLPKIAWEGIKFATGDPHERVQIVAKAVAEAIPQGKQIVDDVQHPFGTRENTRGLIQLAQFGAPLLEFLPKAKIPVKVMAELEKPPVQPVPAEVPPIQPEATAPSLIASVEPPRPQTPATADVTRAILDRRNALVTEAQQLGQQAEISQQMGQQVHPAVESRIAEINQELNQPAIGSVERSFPQGLPDTPEAIQAWLDEPVAPAEPIPSESRIQAGQPIGIAESPEATTPGDIALGQQPTSPERSPGVAAPEIIGQRLVTGEPVGISQLRTEAELGAGSVEPGAGAELGSGLDFGRDFINKGGDPRLPIRRALASGLVGKNEVGIVHAELERLRMERNKAAALAADNPGDIAAQQAFDAADGTQRAWRKELQPVLTKASDALREAYSQSRAEHDPGSYAGLSDLIDEHFGGAVEPTPVQRTALRKIAGTVRETRARVQQAGEHALTEARRGTKRRMTPEELHRDIQNLIAEEFKDCVV